MCVDVLLAFAALPAQPDRGFALPEIRAGGAFPAPVAVGFHLVDNVVHAWDLAVSLGAASLDLDHDVLAAALRVAQQVPNGAERSADGAAFAPGRDAPGEPDLDRILLLLGRDPAAWAELSRRTASR